MATTHRMLRTRVQCLGGRGVVGRNRRRVPVPRALPSFKRTMRSELFTKKKDELDGMAANMLIFLPKAFEDAGSGALRALGMGKPVLINLTFIHGVAEQQRLLDFVTGGCFALGGSQTKVAEGVVLFTPKGCTVSTLPLEPAAPQAVDETLAREMQLDVAQDAGWVDS